MPRLNVYVPDDIGELVQRWRDTRNLSAICTQALREELLASEGHRSVGNLLHNLMGPSVEEAALANELGLQDVRVCDAPTNPAQLREAIGKKAARYLESQLVDDAQLAIAGGRQTWCVVRELSSRRLRLTITALGLGQNDPRVLHAHPNTLTTLLWLLFAPRSDAHLVGAPAFSQIWKNDLPAEQFPRHFVIASCGLFDKRSEFAALLGPEVTRALESAGAVGDFAYQFFDPDGELLNQPAVPSSSLLSPGALRGLSARSDARIVLVAGGPDKVKLIQFAIRLRVCNTLITDQATAAQLRNPDHERSFQ